MKPAVLFDMDMTLFATKQCVRKAAYNYFHSHGFDITAIDFQTFIGIRESCILKYCCNIAGIEYDDHVKVAVMDEYVRLAPDMVKVYSGVEELLMTLYKEGWDIALCTSAELRKVYANFAMTNINASIFGAVVTSENVLRAKPSPEIFLTAAKKLLRPPSQCIVVEDSINGIKAARNAGMKSIVIEGNSFAKARLEEAGADIIVSSISEVYNILKTMDT